jgi:cytochrome c oxidase subunit II
MLFLSANTLSQISDSTPNSLDTAGPFAANIALLWWVMLFFGTLVFVLVVGLMLFALFKRQEEEEAVSEQHIIRRWIVLGGIVMPSIILLIVFGFTIHTSNVEARSSGEMTIEVIGRQWWWEINYPEQGIISANELHIPVDVPVEVRLLSGDVIHSFWVPQLQGKMDMIPGRENKLIIEASRPGVFRGECAEFCGLQHARMHFMVVAQSQDEFEQWVAQQQEPARQPSDELTQTGQDIFIAAGCVYCHNVRGLDSGDVNRSAVALGPDLTHLASRMTIGAGTLRNNRGNLGGWISNPHGRKPGVLMPANQMSGEELQALLTYLVSLR